MRAYRAWLAVMLVVTIHAAVLMSTAGADILSDKRGYADTGASYSGLQATGAGWYYNWGTAPGNIGGFDATQRPMFWGWQSQGSIDYALSLNPDYILGYNEPERSDQANIAVADAITNWTTISNSTDAYNSSHGTSIKLTSPAVSDTGDGKAWMSSFMTDAQNAGLQVDAVAFHWYGVSNPNDPAGAASSFIGSMNWYHQWGLPVFVTEFAIHDWGGSYPVEDMIEANRQFLDIVVPWLESTSWVEGYAFYPWFSDAPLFEGSPWQPTPMAYEYTGVLETGESEDIGGVDLGEHAAYLAGGELTMTGSAGTVNYISALEGTCTVSGTVDYQLSAGSWVRIQPGATLRKTGTNQITFDDVTNNGALHVQDGTLRIGGTVTGSGNIQVNDGGTLELLGRVDVDDVPLFDIRPGGTLDVSGVTFRLRSGQTLNNDSNTTVVGNTFATSGSTVSGAGTFDGNVTAMVGSTLQVGAASLPQQLPGEYELLDNFDSYDNTADTHTTAATGGVWQAEFDGTNNSHVVDVEPSHGQALQTKGGAAWRGAKRSLTGTGAAVEVDETQTYFWQVKASWSGGSTTDWVYDFMMGLSPDVSNIDQYNAYQDFSVMPFINNAPDTPYINAEGPGTWWAPMNPDEWYNVWVVVDNDATDPTFDLYYSVESDPNNPVLVVADANWRNFSAGLDLNAIGFMAAGYDGSSFLIDNIYYIPGASTDNPLNQTAVPVGETMTVQGNLDIQAGATLAMDIYSPTVHDMLDVQGNFTAAGTLQVTLDAGAPALQQGDLFDLMDVAGTTGGAFDSFSLPSLSTGLVWNITDLITTGELSVVVDVDLDNDGDVDGGDFLLIQQTDPSLVSAWQSLFGSQVVAGTSAVPAGTAVPEPSSLVLMLASGSLLAMRRRRK